MLKKLTATFFILTFIFSLSHQQQNLCGDDPSVTHVADPSSCHLFIGCNRDPNGNVGQITLGSCYGTGADYVYKDPNGRLWCTDVASICPDPLSFCPPEPQADIMVADPLDTTCKRFRPCRTPNAEYSECSPLLNFNRNSGLCDFVQNAPCNSVSMPVACPSGYTGFIPGSACYQFIYCENGVIRFEFECQPGLFFDRDALSCLVDNANICPRVLRHTGPPSV